MELDDMNIEALFDPVASPVVLVRPEGGELRAVYRNPAAIALLGGCEEALAALAPAVVSGESTWSGEVSGRALEVELTGYPGGETLLLIRDVTDSIRRQQERIDASKAALQSALDAANAASRAKTEFLSNMSHDIRTPLNAIIGMTAIAQTYMSSPERVRDCLEKIDLSSRHLLDIINDILDMSRIESGKLSVSVEPFAMADFIHSMMAVFRPQADKRRQQVLLDFSGIRHESVRGDELRLRQVILNILSNAVKFTPEEGTIAMTIRETDRTGAGGNYSYYEFVVRDSGIGMSRDFLKRIFMPFERDTSVNRIEGTGLGMTITHNLVKLMNGEIAVESEPGHGTTFTVTIPLELDEKAEPQVEALRGLRVLAADSSPSSRRSLTEIVSDLGLECDAAGSSDEVLDLARRAGAGGTEYLAALLSWHLTPEDGVATCRRLREILGPNVPVIIMSSYEWTMSDDDMRREGISAFVPKPLFRSRLAGALYGFTPQGRSASEPGGGDSETFDGAKLLLVEDNEINLEIGQELLSLLGASVEVARDGREALDMFRDSPPGRFDLIFMDIQMPVMDGYAATRAIRALPREDARTIPIVAMSANAFVEDIRACHEAGMDGHVPKPVSLRSLSDALRAHMPEYAGRKEGGGRI